LAAELFWARRSGEIPCSRFGPRIKSPPSGFASSLIGSHSSIDTAEIRLSLRRRGQFFKAKFAPTRQVRAYEASSRLRNSDAYSLVGASARVGAYASFKKLPSGANPRVTTPAL
jgi:hypothetical protein